jgi:RES domain-containing protein
MNKNTTRRKLVLHRKTVRRLTSAQLARIAGGRWNQTIVTQCECPTFTCDTTDNVTRNQGECTLTDTTASCSLGDCSL